MKHKSAVPHPYLMGSISQCLVSLPFSLFTKHPRLLHAPSHPSGGGVSAIWGDQPFGVAGLYVLDLSLWPVMIDFALTFIEAYS